MDPSEELARVYADAEHALSLLVAREVARDLERDGDGPTETAARLAAVRALRVAAQGAVRELDGTVPPLVRQVLEASAEQGTAAARVALARVLGGPTDAEPFDRRRLDLLAAAVLDQITPRHAAIVRAVPDVYRDVIRRSAPALLVGAQTRREAAQRAMLEFARRGVTGFTDRAGRRWELASYVEMALRTAAARTATDAQVERLAVDGHHLVMVTDAPQECALCRPFEGRVLTTTGQPGVIRVEHAIQDGVMVEVNVVDTLDGARAKGFQHPNCRHTVKLYLPGVTKAPTGPGTGPDPKGDEARQRQRAIEREIRRHKRGADLALDAPARKAANTRVREWQARMREHLAEHPELRRLTYREAPGVGNTPPVDLVERLGGDTPFPDLPREQVDEPEVQERPEPVEEPAVEEPQAEEQEPAAEERPARALPVVDEAAVEARAKAVEKVLRPFRDVFDPLQLRGVIRDHLREAYPDVPVRERRELERTLARAGARTSTPPGRGIRLALRAQARRAAAAADGRTAAELVELARTVVGDVALFGRTADGRMDLDRDGGYSAATRAKLDAVRTVGAAVRAEVDRRIEALAQAAQPSEGGARPRIVATNSAARRRTEAEIRRAVLAELRPMGRNGRDEIPIRYHPSLSDPADQETYGGMVRRAQDVYPTAWLAGNRAAQRGGLIVQAKGDAASMGNRAYYDPTFHLIETGRYSDPQQAEAIVIHELGHAMEKTLPWIRQAERVFLHDRISRGKPGKRTADEASVIYEGTDELGFEDDFPQHYTGKTYGDGSDRQAFEVLTTGVQHLLGGDGDYADGDMEDFILGMLAVL